MPVGKYIDCTLGEGSVTEALLSSGAQVLGMDADPEMLSSAARRLGDMPDASYTLVQANFASLKEVACANGFTQAQGIIMDVGLSSRQLQAIRRGFTFQNDQPLDMRYDPRQDVTAADLVNDLPEQELIDLLRTYGEEDTWSARSIARTIMGRRPLHTTRELVECIELAVGQRSAARIHPATKAFMALRLVVNADLQALELALPQALELLAPGGRLAVIGYQSLEDRIIKRFLHQEAKDCLCPPTQTGLLMRTHGDGQAAAAAGHHAHHRRDFAQPRKPVGPASDCRAHRGVTGSELERERIQGNAAREA